MIEREKWDGEEEIEISNACHLEECEPGYVLGSVTILGHNFHFEMVEVERGENGMQQAVHHEGENYNDTRLDALFGLDPEGPFNTVEWQGRQWVVWVCPGK